MSCSLPVIRHDKSFINSVSIEKLKKSPRGVKRAGNDAAFSRPREQPLVAAAVVVVGVAEAAWV